jgi:cytochrome c5/Ca2+-binding RTX toxin-like protein
MTAQILYFGITNDFFENAFDDIRVSSANPTLVTAVNPDTGYQTILTGTNFSGDLAAGTLGGTLTSMSIADSGGNPVISIGGIAWSAQAFVDAIIELLDDSDSNDSGDGLEALLGLQSINFDASASNIGADFFFDGITQPINILGSDNRDTLSGGDLNDTINPGNTAEFNGEAIFGSLGSDTIDLGNLGPNRWADITYEELDTAVTVNLDGAAGNLTVNKATVGTDTVVNFTNPLDYGLGFYGSRANDTFNIDPGSSDNWVGVNGMGGNDTFNLTLNGTVRVNYSGGWEDGPFTGATINLATGVVANDGHGGTDIINILGGSGRFELQGSNNADNITGSNRNETFILRGGEDTLDADGGFDTLRYDRSGVESVNLDLQAGVATGVWHDSNFNHTISNIEEVRGSRDGNDVLSGDATDNKLQAYDGNDSIYAGDGTDEIFGGNGDDYLNAGNNEDYDFVDAGAGNDHVDAFDMTQGFLEVSHYELRNSTSQTITYDSTAAQSAIFGSAATIDKRAFGTTTVGFADHAIQADGLFIEGGDLDDTFTATLDIDGWIGFKGGRGDDTYTINTSGEGDDATVRLNYDTGISSNDRPDQGINVDLETGIIANDGFGGRDVITGSYTATIEIRGTDNTDIVMGSDRDERFIGRGGNDTFDGKGGFDAVRFDRDDVDGGVRVDLGAGTATGSFSGIAFNYALTNIEGAAGSYDADVLIGSTGSDGFAGRDGDDTIFADGAAATYYGANVANQVYRLYQATLDRAPDVGGHANWSERIATGERTLLEVVEGFVGSPEFTATYSADLSNEGFVTLLYNNVLGRNPDAQGLARWTGDLEGGSSRAQVVLGFSESPQFTNETTAQANTFANNSLDSTWSDDVFRLYQATLARAPDLQGQTNWSERLANGERTLLEVANGFVGSQEFTNVYSADISNTEFVTLLYDNVLGTTPDAQGLARWTGELESGANRAEVVLGFSQSPQFTNETAADLRTWMRDQGDHDGIAAGAGENVVAGGQFADTFIFQSGETGSTTVLDFEAWDYLEMSSFEYNNLAQLKSHMTQQGGDVIFNDQSVEVILEDTALADIVLDTFVDTFFLIN